MIIPRGNWLMRVKKGDVGVPKLREVVQIPLKLRQNILIRVIPAQSDADRNNSSNVNTFLLTGDGAKKCLSFKDYCWVLILIVKIL